MYTNMTENWNTDTNKKVEYRHNEKKLRHKRELKYRHGREFWNIKTQLTEEYRHYKEKHRQHKTEYRHGKEN